MPDEQKDPKDQEIIDLKTKLATAEQATTDKATELTAATGVISELKTKLDTAQTALEAKDQQLEKAAEVVLELKAKLTEAPLEVKAEGHGQLKSGKDTYELTIPSFNHLGEIITHAVLQERPRLVERLVKEGVGFLRKVV